jgi:hypothetical protein
LPCHPDRDVIEAHTADERFEAMGRLSEGLTDLMHLVDRRIGWHRLPVPLGLLGLAEMRKRLRERNLFDTGEPLGLAPPTRDDDGEPPRYLTARTVDGTYNDLDHPLMGSTGTRFGRNIPLESTFPEQPPQLLDPNPRKLSLKLLTREQFIPATTLNILAGAWLQFEVHDWFSHGKNDPLEPWLLDCDDDDPWPERPMRVQRTTRDATSDPTGAQTWVTADSHWWDGSQIYGRDLGFADKARANEDGKLRVDADGMLPADLEEGLDLSDVAGNHWIGLAVLHTLFTLEHNSICDYLRARYPTWPDDRVFDKARLINSALMAKIHTLDWTPAIIAHPTTKIGMRANWWGLVGERVTKRVGRLGKSEAISGIVGSPHDHHGVPYSLTEEFVAVYRMHQLLPDEFTFRSVGNDEMIRELTFPELNALHARDRLGEIAMPNALYSLGIAHPGAIKLHNYPRFLQHFERPDGTLMDLAATDILRIRERGVPRYTRFRELFHMRPVRRFDELTDNPAWAEEMRDAYGGDIDKVDLIIGLYAEPFPKGFGFSDTAFRVFILMASRRLKSDRFFTVDYTPEVYTPEGLEWVRRNDMRSVLLRHFPALEPALAGVENPFAPWRRVRSPRRAAEQAAVRAAS